MVICPEGKELPFRRERVKNPRTGHTVREYRSATVCQGCPVRACCTKDRHGRSIEIPIGYEAVQRLKKRLAEPGNQEKLKRRGRTVELIFAWIKQMDGFRRWTVHGLANVKAQWSMLCAVWNLKQIYKKWLEDKRMGNEAVKIQEKSRSTEIRISEALKRMRRVVFEWVSLSVHGFGERKIILPVH